MAEITEEVEMIMKTLDEVIKAFEWCIRDDLEDCTGCPYDTGEELDCHERNIDALYYLKEYNWMDKALDPSKRGNNDDIR